MKMILSNDTCPRRPPRPKAAQQLGFQTQIPAVAEASETKAAGTGEAWAHHLPYISFEDILHDGRRADAAASGI